MTFRQWKSLSQTITQLCPPIFFIVYFSSNKEIDQHQKEHYNSCHLYSGTDWLFSHFTHVISLDLLFKIFWFFFCKSLSSKLVEFYWEDLGVDCWGDVRVGEVANYWNIGTHWNISSWSTTANKQTRSCFIIVWFILMIQNISPLQSKACFMFKFIPLSKFKLEYKTIIFL